MFFFFSTQLPVKYWKNWHVGSTDWLFLNFLPHFYMNKIISNFISNFENLEKFCSNPVPFKAVLTVTEKSKSVRSIKKLVEKCQKWYSLSWLKSNREVSGFVRTHTQVIQPVRVQSTVARVRQVSGSVNTQWKV